MKQLRGKPLKDFLKEAPRPDRELIFMLQDVEDPVNVGSAFRIADAAGVNQLILTGISARPPHPLIRKVGRGRDRAGEVELYGTCSRCDSRSQHTGLCSVAHLEITAAVCAVQ